MDEEAAAKLEGLRKDYLDMERTAHEERECLVKIINTLGIVMAKHEDLAEPYDGVRELIDVDKALQTDLIEPRVAELRSRIFSSEVRTEPGQESQEAASELKERLLSMCRMIQRVTALLLDDFYPVTGGLARKAHEIDVKWRADMERAELERAAASYPEFLQGLRTKISMDFRETHKALAVFLDHVGELEKTLVSEFGSDTRKTEFEEFESKVANEVGSIVDSFNIHKTLDEIKSSVVAKLKQIKRIISTKKQEEMKKARRAQENIDVLKSKISKAEKDALEMTKKAERFERAATKDWLTGLNNRYTFDACLSDTQNAFSEEGKSFVLGIFDVDNFKWINDSFGHVSGDKILKRVAQCLQETFRKEDFIARIGGDEFAVIIQGLTVEMARERVSAFSENFTKKRFFSQNKGDINVTVSAGIAEASMSEPLDELMHRADKDMYAAKKARKSTQESGASGTEERKD